MQNKHSTIGYSEQQETLSFLTAVFLALTAAYPLFIFASSLMPPHWLAGMDGYFYGSMIKTYLNQFHFSALDMESPLNYPPYFFYLLGMVGRIFGVTDLGFLQMTGAVIAYTSFPILSFILLRPVLGPARAALAVFAMFLFSGLGYGNVHVWQKPHEIMALIGISGIFVFLNNLFSETQSSRPHRIFAGVITGFALGSYTPFMVASVLSGVCCSLVFLIIPSRKSLKEKFIRLFDWPFLIPALLIVTPYALNLGITMLTHNEGVGVVTWFHEKDFHFDFLVPRNIAVPYYVALLLTALAAVKYFWTRNFKSVREIYPILLIVLGLAAYVHLFFAYQKGDYTTAPFKYFLHIPFAGGLLCAALIPAERFYSALENRLSKPMQVTALLVMAMLASSLVVGFMQKHSEAKRGTELSIARWKNIAEIVNEIDERKKTEKLERYLASYENTFLNYYVKGKFANHIIFNHSYASTYEDIPARSKALLQAIAEGSLALHEHLKQSRVDVLLLQSPPEDRNNYIIKHTLNIGKEMSIPQEILIPVKHMDELVRDGKLKKDIRGNVSIYTIL